MKPMLVAVTGPDGSGKSTLVRAVHALLGPKAACPVQVWDALDGLISRTDAQRYLGTIGHRSRATLLLHAVSRALDLALASGARVILLDGYWFKYAVSEAEHGAPIALFDACRSSFPRPELTVFLDLDVEARARRKTRYSPYEIGFADEADPVVAFVGFQRRLEPRWSALEAEVGPWLHLDAERSVDQLSARVLAAIDALEAT